MADKTRLKEAYQVPFAQVIEVAVERGFAVTNPPLTPGDPWA